MTINSQTRMALILTLILVSGILGACNPTGRCGTFGFTGSLNDSSTNNGINASVDFDLNPSACGSPATCDLVAWVQIVRTLDLDTFAGLYPSSEKADRATADGWYIDRVAGRIWGYYGRNDDGSFASYVTTGSDTSTATLGDAPSRPESEPWLDIWWMAVSVPVCLDTDSAILNNLAGYYFWSFTVDDRGVVDGPIDAIAWVPQDVSFADAVVLWNAQAPGLGKNTFPSFANLAP
jgi:hypothetical protein